MHTRRAHEQCGEGRSTPAPPTAIVLRHLREAAGSRGVCAGSREVSLFSKRVQLLDVEQNSVIQLGAYLEGSETLLYCAQQRISGYVFNHVAFGTSRLGWV